MGQLTFQATLGGAVNLVGPNTASTTSFTLPSADGTSGQALTTNGSGTLAFGTLAVTAGGTGVTTSTGSGSNVLSASPTFTGDVTLNAQGDLRFADSDSSNWVAFQAPATIASNVTWTLPSADGTSNQVLSTNGSGVLSWATAGGGGSAATPTTLGTVYGKMDSGYPNNAAVGYNALLNNTATNNAALGFGALQATVSGGGNVAVGYAALNVNTSYANVAVGSEALIANTAGNLNVAVGANALRSITTGDSCTAVGYDSLRNNTAVGNTAFGRDSLKANTSGGSNTALGNAALVSNVTSSSNTAVGVLSMFQCTGGENTAVGAGSGASISSGTQNVSIGKDSGAVTTTGSQNVSIGFDTKTSAAAGQGQITIGYGLAGQGNNHVTMGTNSSKIYVNYTATGTWTQTSDATLKNVIGQETLGLSFINRLNPVTFTWKSQTDLPVDHPHYNTTNKKNITTVMHGLLAQDVKAAMDAEGCATFNGWDQGPDGVQAVSREMFVTPLIKAIQELSAQVESLKARLDAANL